MLICGEALDREVTGSPMYHSCIALTCHRRGSQGPKRRCRLISPQASWWGREHIVVGQPLAAALPKGSFVL